MKKVMVAAVGAAMLSGCAHDYREAGRVLNGSRPIELADQILSRADPDVDPVSIRRDLVRGIAARSDVECEDYLVGVSVASQGTEALLSVGGLALGTASAVATPERSSKLLAQLSALTGTTSNALADSVFAGRDFQIIYTAIQTGRRRDREALFQRVEAGDFDDWGYESIVAAVTPYHLNCGLNYGMQQITEAVEEQARRQTDLTAGGAAAAIAPPVPPPGGGAPVVPATPPRSQTR